MDATTTKPSDAAMRAARAMVGAGFSKSEVARTFRVNVCTIKRIASGKTWKHELLDLALGERHVEHAVDRFLDDMTGVK